MRTLIPQPLTISVADTRLYVYFCRVASLFPTKPVLLICTALFTTKRLIQFAVYAVLGII